MNREDTASQEPEQSPKIYIDTPPLEHKLSTNPYLCTVIMQRTKYVSYMVDRNGGGGGRDRVTSMEKVDSQNLGQMIKTK